MTSASEYTTEFGPCTPQVARFLSAIETLTTDQLARAEAASDTSDWTWDRSWDSATSLARLFGLYPQLDAAIDAAWEHAAKRPDFERWDHVWEHAASHTAAALVISHHLPAPMVNRLSRAFIAAGVIEAAHDETTED